jgi:SAM-dependent methyltransferase
MTPISPSLSDWFGGSLGAYTLAQERAWIDSVAPDIFGFHALQLGLPTLDLLRESRIAHRHVVAAEIGGSGANVLANFHELPFDSHSIDLCLLPHTLEFVANPHEVLREVDRVMRPEGRILIIGFNPWSLYGLRKAWSTQGAPWNGQFVSLVRMKDWLQLLSFEPATGKLACYIPPLESQTWHSRLQFMEASGDRWWGVAGGVYMLEAVKRVQGMRLIAPAWASRSAKERKYAAAASRAARARASAAVDGATTSHLRLVK